MNKVAHYNGFVGRCQQYGLTKQAADMLYKQAGILDELKESGKDLLSAYNRLSPEEKAGLIGAAAGGTLGLGGGLLTGQGLGQSALLALAGSGVGGIGGYGGTRLWQNIADRKLINKMLKTMGKYQGDLNAPSEFRSLDGYATKVTARGRNARETKRRLLDALAQGQHIGARASRLNRKLIDRWISDND